MKHAFILVLILSLDLALASEVLAASRTIGYTYNNRSLITAVDGPRTDVEDITRYTYDNQGNRTAVTNALGHTTRLPDYDAVGRPLTLIDPNGLIIRLRYDDRGRLIEQNQGGEVTQFAYSATGTLSVVTHADGTRIFFRYDAAHRLVGITDDHGNRIVYSLDAAGNRLEENVFDPGGTLKRTRSHVFDGLSRLIETIGADGKRTRYRYDPNGNRTSTLDAQSRSTDYTFDALDRLVKSLDPLGGEVHYVYNTQDNLIAVTDPNGNTTHYQYDGLGNLVSRGSPDTGLATYTHDAAGNVLTQTDVKGQVTTYAYDALNRLATATDADGSVTTYTYDSAVNGIGRLAEISDESGSTAFEYDLRGRVTARHQSILVDGVERLLTTRYRYNDAGQRIGLTYPSGLQVDYVYDHGQIAGILLDGAPLLSDVAYAPFGPVTGWIWGNGQQAVRRYDLEGRLVSQSLGPDERQLTYDEIGNITSITEAATDSVFQYDALDRLTGAADPDFRLTWRYDANGNRLQQDDEMRALISTYTLDPSSNRLLNVDQGGTHRPRGYDANGNTVFDGEFLYTYNARDRLVKVDSAKGCTDAGDTACIGSLDGDTGQYRYNALGQRVYKRTGGGGPDYAALAHQTRREDEEHSERAAELDQEAQSAEQEARSLDHQTLTAQLQATSAGHDAERLKRRAARESERAAVLAERARQWTERAAHYRTEVADSPTSWWEHLTNEINQRLADFYQGLADSTTNQAEEHLKQAELLTDQAETRQEEADTFRRQAEELTQQATSAHQQGDTLTAQSAAQKQLAEAALARAADYERIARQNASTSVSLTTLFAYDQSGQLLGEYDPDGNPRQETVWFGNLPVATVQAGKVYYVHADHLGTPRVITDPAMATVIWRWDSDPFGTKAPNEDPDADGIKLAYPLRFPGQYFDSETGLHYNYFRHYDPGTGQYIQSDPIGLAGGINTYQYVRANPITLADPHGLIAAVDDVFIGGSVVIVGCAISPGCRESLANAASTAASAAGKVVEQIREWCESENDADECGPRTRAQALREAQAWAGVPRQSRGRQPIPFTKVNEQSRGANSAHIQRNGGTHAGYYIPYGRNRVEDHPDGHPHMLGEGEPNHHMCPHFHAVNGKGEERIFSYKRGS